MKFLDRESVVWKNKGREKKNTKKNEEYHVFIGIPERNLDYTGTQWGQDHQASKSCPKVNRLRSRNK